MSNSKKIGPGRGPDWTGSESSPTEAADNDVGNLLLFDDNFADAVPKELIGRFPLQVLNQLYELKDNPNLLLASAALMNAAVNQALDNAEAGSVSPQIAALVAMPIEEMRRHCARLLSPPELKLVRQVEPSPAAFGIMKIGAEWEREKMGKQEYRRGELLKALLFLVTEALAKIGEIDAAAFDFATRSIRDVAKKYARKKRASVDELLNELLSSSILAGPPLNLKRHHFNQVLANDSDLTMRLQELLREEEGPSTAFLHLYEARTAYRTMSLADSWRRVVVEKAGKHPDMLSNLAGDVSSQLAPTHLASKFELHPSVVGTHDIAELQKMALRIPLDAETYRIVQSASAKLEMMHALLLVDSEVDFEAQAAASEFVDRVFKERFSHRYPEGLVLNPPTDAVGNIIPTLEHSEYHVLVDRVEIDLTGKMRESTAVKLLLRELISTQMMFDRARGRIFATPEDTFKADPATGEILYGEYDEEKLHAWCRKVVGILLSWFGDEIDMSRIRYTVRSGGSNENSTGKHRGVHVTILVKHQSNVNGIDVRSGGLRPGVKVFELQALGWMSPDEAQKDHDHYKESSKGSLLERLGCSTSYKEFVVDLMEVLGSKACELGVRAEAKELRIDSAFAEYYERCLGIADIDTLPHLVSIPELLKNGRVPLDGNFDNIALLFLEILTRRDENSRLVNEDLLKELNRTHSGQLSRITNILKRWQRRHSDSKFLELIKYRAYLLDREVMKRDKKPYRSSTSIFNRRGSRRGAARYSIGTLVRHGIDDKRFEYPYKGVVTQEVVQADKKTKHYYDVNVDGSRSEYPNYVIEEDSNGLLSCHLISSDGEGRVLLWHSDLSEDGERIVLHPVIHGLQQNPSTGAMSLAGKEYCEDPAYERRYEEKDSIRPHNGMLPGPRQVYELVLRFENQQDAKGKPQVKTSSPRSRKKHRGSGSRN